MVVVACTLGSQLRVAMGLCLGFFSWDFLMKHFGHGHNVHMFSFHILIPSRFPCLISHTYNSSFCEVHHNALLT